MKRINYRRFLARQAQRRKAAQGVEAVRDDRLRRQQQRLDIENWARRQQAQ